MLSCAALVSGSLQLEDGRTIPVVDGLVIGRSPDCAVPLRDEKSSRHHARIVVQVGVVEVEDLDSRNGTLLNGTRVKRRMLRDGDVITVGTTRLVYHVGAPAVAAASAAPGPAPGEDLFGDDAPAVESRPAALAPAPKAPPTPEKKPAAPVDVLEFVDDDIVEVRKPAAAPAAAAGAAPRGGTAAAPSAGANRVGGVLQFSARPDKRGVLAGDVSQIGGLAKLLLVVLALGLAAGAAWLAMRFVGG